jgi:hypothetical protein
MLRRMGFAEGIAGAPFALLEFICAFVALTKSTLWPALGILKVA